MTNVLFSRDSEGLDPVLTQVADFRWARGFDLRHRMAMGQVFYCLGGSGRWAIDGQWFEVATGDLFWNRPDCERAIRCPDQDLAVLMFSLAGSQVHAVMERHLGPEPGGCRRPEDGPQLVELWQLLIALADRRGSVDRESATHLGLGLLAMAGNALRSPRRIVPSRYRTFQMAKHLIEEHHLHLQDLAEVARACGISGAYLSRLFREHMGTTAQAYLAQLRMGHAVERLAHSSLAIKQIGFELGFGSAAAFSKAFKRVIGCAPAAYRQDQRQRQR